jgi:hypothetical protein
MAELQIAIPRDEIAAFCRRNRVRRLTLFGFDISRTWL